MPVPSRAGAEFHPGSVPSYVWAVPAFATFLICLAAIDHQVLWQDELSTVSAASRSLGDLGRLVDGRDAVLGVYYALIHVWTDIAGVTPLALRLPSAFAMAIAAALVALIANRLFGPRAGLAAGLLTAVTPAVSAFGQEARPYAFALMLATLATWLMLRAIERPTWPRWLLYGLGLIALGYIQLTAIALVAGHAAWVGAEWSRSADRRLAGWIAASFGAGLTLVPLVIAGSQQSSQIGGIAETTLDRVAILPGQLFDSPLVAIAVIGLALVAVRADRRAGLMCLGLAVIPVVLILLVSLDIPLLRSRYLLFTIFAWLVLAGATLARLRYGPLAIAILVIAAIGVPAQLEIRATVFVDQHGDQQPDYRTIGEVLDAEAEQGDAIVMPGSRFRIGVGLYGDRQVELDDALVIEDAAVAAELDSRECRPATCFGTPDRLWVGCDHDCPSPLAGIRLDTAAVIAERGYELAQTWPVEGGAISLYTRPAV